MENRKFYARMASANTCNNEKEKMMVKVSNSARISTARNMNRYCSWYASQEDFEDAASEAAVNALTHADLSGAAMSYANSCGLSSAIKAGKKAIKQNKTTYRIDLAEIPCVQFVSDISADSGLNAAEEEKESIIRWQILQRCIDSLPEADQIMIGMMEAETPYREIAECLGCSEGAVQKRAHDLRMRMHRSMWSNGYFDHL